MKIVERQITSNLYKKHQGPLNSCLQHQGPQYPNLAVFQISGEISPVYEYCICNHSWGGRSQLKYLMKSVAEKYKNEKAMIS